MEKEIIERLLQYMDASTCNFMAVEAIKGALDDAGFTQLYEQNSWDVVSGGKYYVIKNGSAIFAFIAGISPIEQAGVRIISAHTDSPCFKLKPNCEIYGDGGVVSLNIEKYGGGIMYTWFDRPLSISGRVMVRTDDPLKPICINIDLKQPIATIPHLAIHFNRAVNEGNPLSVQKDMKPVVGYFDDEKIAYYKSHGGVIRSLIADAIKESYEMPQACSVIMPKYLNMPCNDLDGNDILDYELCLYPTDKSKLIGINQEYFQSGRIDDLSMAYAGLEALLAEANHPSGATRILALFDNEETGSGTKQGASSPVLLHIIERLCLQLSDNPEALYIALANSFMISADDAHGWHPNYNEKYDPTNHPILGGGPVVKINANCKYMTDAHGAAVFHTLCDDAGVNMQYFVNHADVAGGSTLGNISSSQIDISGVDVGCAIWAMHSAAETAAVSDHLDMIKVFRQFLK